MLVDAHHGIPDAHVAAQPAALFVRVRAVEHHQHAEAALVGGRATRREISHARTPEQRDGRGVAAEREPHEPCLLPGEPPDRSIPRARYVTAWRAEARSRDLRVASPDLRFGDLAVREDEAQHVARRVVGRLDPHHLTLSDAVIQASALEHEGEQAVALDAVLAEVDHLRMLQARADDGGQREESDGGHAAILAHRGGGADPLRS